MQQLCDGDEVTLLKRLLTEIYPNTSFSAVLDSYDYWNIIDNVLPQIKDEILAHNGYMLMRGDLSDSYGTWICLLECGTGGWLIFHAVY